MRLCQQEIIVGRQQRKLMTNTELRKKGVNRADLHAGATAAIAQRCGVNVVLSIGW